MHLNLYREIEANRYHFSYTQNISNVTKVFKCSICNTLISEYKKLKRHSTICNGGVPKTIFEDGNYESQKSIFEQLDAVSIQVPDEERFYPYFIVCDFETWLKTNEDNQTGNLKYIGTYELMSISLIGSEEESPIFISVESTSEDALQTMIDMMDVIRNKYAQTLCQKFNKYFKNL